MTQPAIQTPSPDVIPEMFQGFPFTLLTPRTCRECRAIVDRIKHARSIGRTRVDIRKTGDCTFQKRADIHPLTILIFERCGILITEKTLPAAASAAMGYETPAVVILQAEWKEY